MNDGVDDGVGNGLMMGVWLVRQGRGGEEGEEGIRRPAGAGDERRNRPHPPEIRRSLPQKRYGTLFLYIYIYISILSHILILVGYFV